MMKQSIAILIIAACTAWASSPALDAVLKNSTLILTGEFVKGGAGPVTEEIGVAHSWVKFKPDSTLYGEQTTNVISIAVNHPYFRGPDKLELIPEKRYIVFLKPGQKAGQFTNADFYFWSHPWNTMLATEVEQWKKRRAQPQD